MPETQAQGFTLSLLLSVLLYLGISVQPFRQRDYLERPEFMLFLRVLSLALFLTPWLDRERGAGT